jgi:hypothetical protein
LNTSQFAIARNKAWVVSVSASLRCPTHCVTAWEAKLDCVFAVVQYEGTNSPDITRPTILQNHKIQTHLTPLLHPDLPQIFRSSIRNSATLSLIETSFATSSSMKRSECRYHRATRDSQAVDAQDQWKSTRCPCHPLSTAARKRDLVCGHVDVLPDTTERQTQWPYIVQATLCPSSGKVDCSKYSPLWYKDKCISHHIKIHSVASCVQDMSGS